MNDGTIAALRESIVEQLGRRKAAAAALNAAREEHRRVMTELSQLYAVRRNLIKSLRGDGVSDTRIAEVLGMARPQVSRERGER